MEKDCFIRINTKIWDFFIPNHGKGTSKLHFFFKILEIKFRNYGLIALGWGTFACQMSLNPRQDDLVIQHLNGQGDLQR